MSRLQVRLLGSPDIRYDDRQVTFPARKALALLTYLLVEQTMQGRDKLAALLWPESHPSRARATLRNSLHQLRKSLPKEDYLHVSRDEIGWDPTADYWLDLDVIRAILRPASQQQLFESDFQEAKTIYRGDFLEGFALGDASEFDDWATYQRERWYQRLEMVFEQLTSRQFEEGQWGETLITLTDWLAHNPLNEKAYRQLMRVYVASGNRTAAIQAYEACRETLQVELGLEPAPKTQTLAERIRTADPGMEVVKSWDSDPNTEPTLSFDHGPLVGRSTEFRLLINHYQQAVNGEPQVVGLIGEAGIGKTRLAEEFSRWAEAQGSDVLFARSYESSHHLSYQPVVEALRPRLERENAPEDLLSDVWLAELGRLLPELYERYPDLESPQLDEATGRTRLYEAITRFLLALINQSSSGPLAPLILVFDDLQWTDTASLDVLRYIERYWRDKRLPVMLLISARIEALQPRSVAHVPELTSWIEEMRRQKAVKTIELTNLEPMDTVAFVSAFGVDDDDAFNQWLFTQSGGQPFYLVETLKDLMARSVLIAAIDEKGERRLKVQKERVSIGGPAEPTPVPDKVRTMILGRLKWLSPVAFDLLAAGAILGQGLNYEILCRIADVTNQVGLPAIDELLQSQLMQEKESTEFYNFADDKIRDVVYIEAGQARRRVFHRRALAELEEMAAPPAQLAYHALAVGDRQAAFGHSLTAGDEALHLYAYKDAIGHYEQACTLLQSRQVIDSNEAVQRLFLQLGRAYELEGDYDQALYTYKRLKALAQSRDDKRLQLAALMAQATVHAAPTQHYDAESVDFLTSQALPLAQELEDVTAEAKILWSLMLLNLFTGETDRAREYGEASLAIARRHKLTRQLAYTHHDLGRVYSFLGQPAKAYDNLQEAQALWRKLDDKAMLADNLNVLAAIAGGTGDFDQALALSAESIQLSETINNVWNQSYGRLVIAYIFFKQGDYGRCIKKMETSIQLGKKAGFMFPTVSGGSLLGFIYTVLGAPEKAESWVALAQAQADQMDPNLRLGPLAASAYISLFRSKLSNTKALLAETLMLSFAQVNDLDFLIVAIISGETWLALKDYQRVVNDTDQFLLLFEGRGMQADAPILKCQKGRALLAMGQYESAAMVLSEARIAAELWGIRPVLWQVLAAQSALARRQGDDLGAEKLRRQAAGVIEEIAQLVSDSELRASFLLTPVVKAILIGPNR